MARKKKPPEDGVIDLPMPIKGLDERTALEYQQAGTSADCQNVRGSRPDNGREGLCQRSGVQKYCPTQLASAESPVQEIHKVVIDQGQGQPFGLGAAYVPIGTSIYIIDKDGNVALVFPAPGGGTAGPGIFDQRGNLIQQQTLGNNFRTSRHNIGPQPDPLNFRRWPAKFGFRFPLFRPQPIWRQGQRILPLGGVGVLGQAQRQNPDVGHDDDDDGFQHIRDMDQFPPGVFGPGAPPLGADLPGGGS